MLRRDAVLDSAARMERKARKKYVSLGREPTAYRLKFVPPNSSMSVIQIKLVQDSQTAKRLKAYMIALSLAAGTSRCGS
jgi:hypothetical protein